MEERMRVYFLERPGRRRPRVVFSDEPYAELLRTEPKEGEIVRDSQTLSVATTRHLRAIRKRSTNLDQWQLFLAPLIELYSLGYVSGFKDRRDSTP